MPTDELSLLKPLELERLREGLQSPGPCITFLMPPYHPGEATGSGAALLRANLKNAAQQLRERCFPKTASEKLLEPIERLAHDSTWLGGAHSGCAIFRSPDWFCQLPLTKPIQPFVTIGGCFAIRHLLLELQVPRLFYILVVSKESVSLFRCLDGEAQPVALPGGIPMALRDALELEPPDHDLQSRSAAGAASGARHRVRFGTGSGRETEHSHLADFYKLVDRGIHTLLHNAGTPLILAGVDEEVAAYRGVSKYPSLVSDHLYGGPPAFPDANLVTRAHSLLRTEEVEREVMALTESRESTGRALTDPDAIIQAAFEGRVNQLYIDESFVIGGVFDKQGYQSWGIEDLLNFAAVHTLLHRGKAFELPGGMMLDRAAAVAILRY